MKIDHHVWKTGEYYSNGEAVVDGRWVYDDEFKRALKHGRDMVAKAKLNQWNHAPYVDRFWNRMSLPWEEKEDNLILSFMDKYEGTGKRGDVIHCLAWCIRRTTTSITTRLNTLKKDKCTCCGK